MSTVQVRGSSSAMMERHGSYSSSTTTTTDAEGWATYPPHQQHQHLSSLESSHNDNNRGMRQSSVVSQQSSLTSNGGTSIGGGVAAGYMLSASLLGGSSMHGGGGGRHNHNNNQGAVVRRPSAISSGGGGPNTGHLMDHPVTTTTAPPPTSSVLKPVAAPRSSSTGMASGPQPNNASVSPDHQETVMIEEKRPRRTPNGQIATGENAGVTIHRYLRGRMLGKGGFAKVYLCTAMDTNKSYAVKIVSKANLTKARARQKLQAEIKIHRTLKHDHICEFKHFFEDRDNCYILLELCHNQSMNEMIKRRKRLTEPEAAFFMTQLLLAVKHMHANIIIHRDLKLGNLFLDRHLNIKVGDFGLATRLEDADEKRKTICGTPNYIAPEVIQGDKEKRGHSFEVDVWSMGVILYTLLVGKPPYEAKDVKATYQRILNNEYSFPTEVPISEAAQHLIRIMLQSKPSDRPSLDEIGCHPFLSQHILPHSVPTSATHLAPIWRLAMDGQSLVADPTPSVRSSNIAAAAAATAAATAESSSTRKGGPRTQASTQRQPFGVRHPNTQQVGPTSAKPKGGGTNVKKERSSRDVIDVQGIIKKGAAMALAAGSSGGGTVKKPLAVPPPPTSSNNGVVKPNQAGFQIFDETDRLVENDLVARTDALTINTQSHTNPRRPDPSTTSSSSTASSTTSSALGGVGSSSSPNQQHALTTPRMESDSETLLWMIDHLETVLDITDARKGCYRPRTPRAVSSSNPGVGPTKWVTRYVDYTSKYGLGFLLNEGSSGVYFNDSTKTALAGGTNNFQYIERVTLPVASSPEPRAAPGTATRRTESTVLTYTLDDFPENLRKKVTLLKHFRNYLLEQQKKAEEAGDCEVTSSIVSPNRGGATTTSATSAASPHFVYVKKWMRTKHAILFRLSDMTVQMVFYDQTEVLLTPNLRYVTYVDKNRMRSTYDFNDELVGGYAELQKRLKYTKDILCQMVYGIAAPVGGASSTGLPAAGTC